MDDIWNADAQERAREQAGDHRRLRNTMSTEHPRFLQLVGLTIGRLTVLRVAPYHDRYRYYACRCTCGNACERSRDYLLRLARLGTYAARGKQFMEAACEPCALAQRAAIAADNARRRWEKSTVTCSECHEPGHNRRVCPLRTNRPKTKWCADCAGLPHRVHGHRCPTCGLDFEPDAPVLLETDGRKAVDWR